ncbi:MAG: nucleoside triphosphate pyrophosphohydrolase [Oscillospiraceae bacterium]|jgi:tetrapyrrole methylase family protein/MazG family protein|nr:nucleoside triphosphate pyrophosphohydrolase [Oscillospiraceae bacterium]
MNNSFEFKEKYQIEDLLHIMSILRSPGGCPWDREQDHQSIKKNFIEETYEVVEAINKDDPALLCEELGDVLLQIVFHARMEEESGRFSFSEVADGICKKLIERHPHVFGDVAVSGSDEVLDNWDAIKRKSKRQKSAAEAMDAVPRELPALMRSTKIQKKAEKVGFDWPDVNGALAKLREETDELTAAIDAGEKAKIQDELGDVLFSAVNVSRFADVDAEEALTQSTDKFFARFSLVENMAKESGIDMKHAGIDELDRLWDKAKIINKD